MERMDMLEAGRAALPFSLTGAQDRVLMQVWHSTLRSDSSGTDMVTSAPVTIAALCICDEHSACS